jgi:hypothetical protein
MSPLEAEPDDRIQSRPDDRREWLGGEALVSFHQRRGSQDPFSLGGSRCNRLTLFLAFAAGLLIGSGVSSWLSFRYGPPRRGHDPGK